MSLYADDLLMYIMDPLSCLPNVLSLLDKFSGDLFFTAVAYISIMRDQFELCGHVEIRHRPESSHKVVDRNTAVFPGTFSG